MQTQLHVSQPCMDTAVSSSSKFSSVTCMLLFQLNIPRMVKCMEYISNYILYSGTMDGCVYIMWHPLNHKTSFNIHYIKYHLYKYNIFTKNKYMVIFVLMENANWCLSSHLHPIFIDTKVTGSQFLNIDCQYKLSLFIPGVYI